MPCTELLMWNTRVEYKKLSEDLLKLLPDCFRNQVVVRVPFAANCQCFASRVVDGTSVKKFAMP